MARDKDMCRELIEGMEEGKFIVVRSSLKYAPDELGTRCVPGLYARVRRVGVINWLTGPVFEVARVSENFALAEYEILGDDRWTVKDGEYLALNVGVDFWKNSRKGERFKTRSLQVTGVENCFSGAFERIRDFMIFHDDGPNMQAEREAVRVTN